MCLDKAGEICFKEILNASAPAELLPPAIRQHQHRRTVAIRISDGARSTLVVLDGEDSLFQTSSLIEHCDLYFSCTFRKKFFNREPFDLELPWQTECELRPYREKYQAVQERFRAHLKKGRLFVPIGPNMEPNLPLNFLNAKVLNLRHRIAKLKAPWLDWGVQFSRFERRWEHLRHLRAKTPIHDVILKDSLWGWPRHRIALHQRLRELSSDFKIGAELHYRVAEPYELGTHPAPVREDFPQIVGQGVAGDYETQLASSRIGVFATGFHYGCRNIVTLAWFLGMRTLVDPQSFEAIYKFEEVGERIHRSGTWAELAAELAAARAELPSERVSRQNRFDQVASPLCAARYLITESLRTPSTS